MTALKRFSFCILLLLMNPAFGAGVDVVVVDRDGNAVANVVVFASGEGLMPDESRDSAVMEQVNQAFSPHILAVRRGESVAFPNNDPFAHHVYSFSRPNDFTQPLSKARNPAPVEFEHVGVVVVGCNIHDNMLGYILVLDAPVFSITDENGRARLDVAGAQSELTFEIWSPRIRDGKDATTRYVAVNNGTRVEFRLQKKLRAEHSQDSWSDY